MEGKPGDLLIVEDNFDDLDLEFEALVKVQLSGLVKVANDGAEAIKYLFSPVGDGEASLRDLPLVIFLDLEMPKVNGFEVLKRIKSDPRTCKIPVVVLTSNRDEFHVRQAYALGANSFIVKPNERKVFKESVGQMGLYWLGLNQAPPPDLF